MSSTLSPLEELEQVIASIGAKADKNKVRARNATLFLTGATAFIPVFIGLGSGLWLGRVVPSVLAALAAVGAAWVQIERPHERWSLYRRHHRAFQMDHVKYVNRVEPYQGEDRDAVLVNRLAAGQMELHNEWAGLLPSTSEVASLGRAAPPR
jgi:hypothetical protein